MTIKKKIIALCAVFILTAGMFALVGCGGDNGSATGGGDTEAPATETDNATGSEESATETDSEQDATPPASTAYKFAFIDVEEFGEAIKKDPMGGYLRIGEELVLKMASDQGFTYKISYYKDIDAALAAMASGEADVVVVSGFDISGAALDVSESFYQDDPTFVYGVAAGKNAEILSKLEAGVAAIEASGEYEEILTTYEEYQSTRT